MQIFIGDLRKMSTRLIFKASEVVISKLGQIFEIVSPLQIYPAQNSRSICQLRYSISPESLIVKGRVDTHWKVNEVLYIFFYSTLGLNPATTVSVLYSLIVAHS
jgi:hypothetical protein